jgi:16S rRNA (adenine1518-N6/adenine1519-N6)-dimethyltransferase
MNTKQSGRPHTPRKRFGQNFLQDQNIIRQLVSFIRPVAGQQLLEIGPGQGALTQPLVESGVQVTCVEIDRDLAALLRERFAACDNFCLVEGDALSLDLASLSGVQGAMRVVGNLPYNISTPLLFHLLSQRSLISDMHFMLQKEVVDRLVACPGTGTYGRLSVMAQYRCDIAHVFDVPPTAFYPVPKVMSAIVRLVPREPLLAALNEQHLAKLVTLAFGQRRKTLRNTLKSYLDDSAFSEVDVDASMRAETLSVSDFVRLANVFSARQSDISQES